jgi:general secretion pathway protein D
MPITTFLRQAFLAAGLALSLAACQTPPVRMDEPPRTTQRTAPLKPGPAVSPELADAAERATDPELRPDPYRIFKGSGVVVRGQQPGGAVPAVPPVRQAGGGVVLNFEGADLREVVRNILGDILNQSYTIDPAVGGQVTIRTTSGIPRDALPATLETLLRMNGATMIKEGDLYKIVPQAAAVRGNVTPQLGGTQRALPAGFSVQIVPLRYVGVRDMLRILEPFARDAQAVRVDELRNLIILSGTERELKHLMDTIDMFDIDWMAGMSAGVFTLQNAEVKSVMQELEKVIGQPQQSPLAGILRIIPIERLNAILVISPNPSYLDEARKWVERLDRGGNTDSPRLYVYALQNSRAEKVAPLLQQAFTGRMQQTAATTQPTLAPGTPAGSIVSPPSFTPTPQTAPGQPTPQQQAAATAQAQAQVQAAQAAAAARAAKGGPGQGTGIVRNLQAVADKDNNTIIIVATPIEFQIIEAALKKLDTPARQVVIEMTIAEVVLTDSLQFGVEWLFRGASPSGRGSGGLVNNPITGTIPAGSNVVSSTGISSAIQGFTYLISSSKFPGGVAAALRLLDTYGNTKVISNPHIAALDNQKATIKVGNRIPINQTTTVGGVTDGTFSTVSQYIDTGVLVQVTPHINAGGLVTIDVQAEVSQPGPTANPGDAPPINTRSVQTFVAVPSGETMVMGGLILDAKQNNSAGLPLVSRIPILGGLFGDQTLQNDRTELILFVTPRVVDTEFDVRSIVDDLRRRMDRLDNEFPPIRGGAPQVPPSPSPWIAPGAVPVLRPDRDSVFAPK